MSMLRPPLMSHNSGPLLDAETSLKESSREHKAACLRSHIQQEALTAVIDEKMDSNARRVSDQLILDAENEKIKARGAKKKKQRRGRVSKGARSTIYVLPLKYSHQALELSIHEQIQALNRKFEKAARRLRSNARCLRSNNRLLRHFRIR